MGSLTGGIDKRPRVHIRPHPRGIAYRYGPTGADRFAPTPGEAFEQIVAGLGGQAAVIVVEEREQS